MDKEDLEQVKKKIFAYMKEQYNSLGVNMLYFMLTDILNSSTELLCYGENAMEYVENAFDAQGIDGVVELPGVVSRKKQIVPEIMMEVTQ